MRPIGNRIVVSPLREEEKVGSIIIPETASSELRKGKVLFIGTETKTIAKGDTVAFGKHVGVEFKYNDEDVLILNENQVEAVI